MPASDPTRAVVELARGARVRLVSPSGAEVMPPAAPPQSPADASLDRIEAIATLLRETAAEVARVSVQVSDAVRGLDESLAAIGRGLEKVEAGSGDVVRALAQLEATLRQPVVPVYRDGKLIGAERARPTMTKGE